MTETIDQYKSRILSNTEGKDPVEVQRQTPHSLLSLIKGRNADSLRRNPQPGKPFDMDQYMANLIGRFFECRGRELRFDACQTDLASPACSWIPQPPP